MDFRGSLRLLLASLMWLMLHNVEAHTNFGYPEPITRKTCVLGGTGSSIGKCPGPCPTKHNRKTSPEKPAATWKRGEKTTVRWHRNNHRGGFVRLTLVPYEKMMDKKAHTDYAFWYGCFDTGKHRCKNKSIRECGTDEQGYAFQTEITVPQNLPDGKYMMGLAWYGGVTWARKDSFFGDYWACAHVTIEGGSSLKNTWKPVWNGKKCLSAVNKLGDCEREPCTGKKGRMMAPAKFENMSVSNEDDDDSTPEVDEKQNGNEFPKETAEADQSKDITIVGLMLYDVKSNREKGHDFSKPIDVKKYENGLTFVADITGSIKNIAQVEFSVDGSLVRTERFQPYSLSGDTDGTVERWDYPNKDMVDIEVRVVLKSGDSLEKSFKVYLKT